MPGKTTAWGQKPALHWTPHLIKRLRGKRTQAEFGALLGAPKNTVWHWEADQAYPDARYAAGLSELAEREHWGLKLDFGPPPPSGRAVLRLDDVSFGYARQPPLFSEVTLDVQYSERIAVVGPNGAGKTTLLRLIAGQMPPQTGVVRLGVNVRLGVMAQEQETLDLQRTVLQSVLQERAMSETKARNFLHFFLFGGDSVFRPVRACSLGERSRLQLALLVLRGCNFLLLDEPLNHLDIEGREHFEAALDAFAGTVLAVSHDRAFLRSFAERVVEVRAGRVRVFPGGYDDYLEYVGRG